VERLVPQDHRGPDRRGAQPRRAGQPGLGPDARSEEHTSELQSRVDLVCRLLLEKKNIPDLALAPIAVRYDSSLYERSIEVCNEHVEATAARHHFYLVDLVGANKRLRGKHSQVVP